MNFFSLLLAALNWCIETQRISFFLHLKRSLPSILKMKKNETSDIVAAFSLFFSQWKNQMRLESPDAAAAILIDIHVFSRYSERYFHFSPSIVPLVLCARGSASLFLSVICDLCVYLFVRHNATNWNRFVELQEKRNKFFISATVAIFFAFWDRKLSQTKANEKWMLPSQ